MPKACDSPRAVVIGPSNIGDAVLMSPVIERLRSSHPLASLALFVGARAYGIFDADTRIQELRCLDDFKGAKGKLRLLRFIWSFQPDVLVDFRNSILPFFWRPWRIWRYLRCAPSDLPHMRSRYLWRLLAQAPGLRAGSGYNGGCALWLSEKVCAYADDLLTELGINQARALVIVSASARSHIKRWNARGFAQTADRLIREAEAEILLTGEAEEAPIIDDVAEEMREHAHKLTGRTNILQLAGLMRRASLVITNDSASLHIASILDIPTVAVFGPTNAARYGPRATSNRLIRRQLFCSPCEDSACRFNLECMRFITADEVYRAAREMLDTGKRTTQHG